jgi:hypothetical protein
MLQVYVAVWAPYTGPLLVVQLAAAPETVHVKVPVGAGNNVLPDTTAEKVNVPPTSGEGGVALTLIVGKAVPRLIVNWEELAAR